MRYLILILLLSGCAFMNEQQAAWEARQAAMGYPAQRQFYYAPQPQIVPQMNFGNNRQTNCYTYDMGGGQTGISCR
jgi:hypothetical protein